jgi:hypothetical protein
LLHDPKWVAKQAGHGKSVTTYYYAANNPLANIDPTGLYQFASQDLRNSCPNYDAALIKAQVYAGCKSDGTAETSCKCAKAVEACSSGCDICRVLADNQGPTITGLTDDKNVGGGYPFFQRLGLDKPDCTSPVDVRALAMTLVHEAMHQCKMTGYVKDIEDLASGASDAEWNCTAEMLTMQCFKR